MQSKSPTTNLSEKSVPILRTLTVICNFCHFAIGKRNIYIFYFPFIYYYLSIFCFSFATWQIGKSGKTFTPCVP